MTVHTGKGCNGKGTGQGISEAGGSQGIPTSVTTWNATHMPVIIQVNRVGPGPADHGSGRESNQPSSSHAGGSQGYTAPVNSSDNWNPPEWLRNPEFAHAAAPPLLPQNVQLPRNRNGSCYLIDVCPDITGTTPKLEIKRGFPWRFLRDADFVERRTWKFIQNWRVFAHSQLRLKK